MPPENTALVDAASAKLDEAVNKQITILKQKFLALYDSYFETSQHFFYFEDILHQI